MRKADFYGPALIAHLNSTETSMQLSEIITLFAVCHKKKNLHYVKFYPNSEKPIKAVIRHILPDTPEEDISNSLEALGFNIINLR
jgi:hypothetical protein